MEKNIEDALSRESLNRVGVKHKLETWIRPRKPLPVSRQKNIFALLKEDLKTAQKDSTRTIAQGVKAIIGAVYFEHGIVQVMRLMQGWKIWVSKKPVKE